MAPQRPYHRRNASSKSNILRALVSPKSRADEQQSNQHSRTQTVPLLPPDHPHAAAKSRVLGERQGNVQSPPLSPSKSRPKAMVVSKTSHDLRTQAPMSSPRGAPASPKKSKSSTNLSNVFAKMNRSSKDLSAPVHKDKENTTPPSSSSGPLETPIWAQYASTTEVKPRSRPSTRDSNKSVKNIRDEIERYTPQEYSPSKQRNFNGDLSQPQLRPTLGSRPRPQSEYVLGTDLMGAIGRRLSGDRTSLVGRRSDDLDRRTSKDVTRRVSGDKTWLSRKDTERKASGSSMEQAPMKEKLTIAKRGGRVMAAVAAFQGKNKDQAVKDKAEAALDPKAVDQAFEAVLDSRNVPEPMRQKMRSLTLRVKADFIKQDQEASKTATNSPVEAVGGNAMKADSATAKAKATSPTEQKQIDDDSKATKRSRARSRTFTFSKGDKRGDASSPSKKQRSQSKSRATSAYDAKDTSLRTPTSPTTPRPSMDRRAAGPASPAEYIAYLRKHQDPVQVEVGRIHKLRILLRNETVAWVDSFLSLGGMTEIVGLLHRIMDLEWREEHEDQLLHDALLCLKGLCTTGRAMEELEKVADHLFPALIAMLFTDSKDEVKRGPAEYSTRAIITNVLCKSCLINPRSTYLRSGSQLPSLRHQLLARSTRGPRPTSLEIPGRAGEARRSATRRFRPRHANATPIQALVPRSEQRDEGSVLDLPTPPQCRTVTKEQNWQRRRQ